jgi:hypothetical protein
MDRVVRVGVRGSVEAPGLARLAQQAGMELIAVVSGTTGAASRLPRP